MASVKTIILTKDGDNIVFDKEPSDIFATLRNGKYVITIIRESEPRSINQNALMWLWFNCISDETCTPIQDVHDYYCAKFLRRQIDWNGTNRTIVEGTRNLTKERMREFLEQIKADASTEFGIRLPVPEDKPFEQFYQTYKQ